MVVLHIFFIGYIVLFFAIAANAFAHVFKITTWYDLLSLKKRPPILHLFWLFLVYPVILGFSAVVAYNLFF